MVSEKLPSGVFKPLLCVALALLLILALGGWGAYQDWSYLRRTVLTTEINRIRSHAIRTASRIERNLLDAAEQKTLNDVVHDKWLRDHWDKYIPPPDSVHGAVVNQQGTILSHSDPLQEGKTLCPGWNMYPDRAAGPDVFVTNCSSLTGGPWTLDIIVPIVRAGEVLGTYHAGASQEWIEMQIANARHRSAIGWCIVMGGIMAVIVLSSYSLYNITRRSALLEAALRQSHSRRLAELHYLIIGMAHEVRNPLNAVRLNLFTADRVFRGETDLDAEEVSTMLGECVREIERVDDLMTLLLGYARADDSEMVNVDVLEEIRSVVQLLAPSLQSRQVALQLDLPKSAECVTRAGRGQVRQVLLNLLNNASDAVANAHGVIQVSLSQTAESIAVTVTDNGPGVLNEHKHRLFSPFFTTKESGTGLGLALVRSLVERSGGSADCICSEAGHCQFQVRWSALTDSAPLLTNV